MTHLGTYAYESNELDSSSYDAYCNSYLFLVVPQDIKSIF